jgi:hypothetical protein
MNGHLGRQRALREDQFSADVERKCLDFRHAFPRHAIHKITGANTYRCTKRFLEIFKPFT